MLLCRSLSIVAHNYWWQYIYTYPSAFAPLTALTSLRCVGIWINTRYCYDTNLVSFQPTPHVCRSSIGTDFETIWREMFRTYNRFAGRCPLIPSSLYEGYPFIPSALPDRWIVVKIWYSMKGYILETCLVWTTVNNAPIRHSYQKHTSLNRQDALFGNQRLLSERRRFLVSRPLKHWKHSQQFLAGSGKLGCLEVDISETNGLNQKL